MPISSAFTRISSRLALRAGCIALLCNATQAFGYGHGAPLSLPHFARGQGVQLWVATLADTAARQLDPGSVLARYAAGRGNSLVVHRGQPPFALRGAGRMLHLAPGQVLTYVEGMGPRTGFTLVAGTLRTGLAVTDPARYGSLLRDPSMFVDAVALDGSAAPLPGGRSRARDSIPAVNRLLFSNLALPQLIDPRVVEAQLKAFSGNTALPDGSRIPERGTEAGRVKARAHLVRTFQALGLESSEKCYNGKACNVEATLWGKDKSSLMLFTSHLDDMTNAGADDNGTGTVVLLEAARVLARQADRGRSVRFVAFDQEELGLIGSRAYVKALSADERKQIRGVVNMDMLGYDGNDDGAFHAMDCDRAESRFMKDALLKLNETAEKPLKWVNACTNRSDHASFWNANIPAIVLSENFFGGDGNPCYHRACDTVEKMTFPYFFRLANLVVNLAAASAAQ